MSTLKGIAIAVRLDEFTIENTENGPKARIRASFFAEFDKQANQARYNRVIFTTRSKYRIEQLAALGLPQGRLDRETIIHLTIPYANLHFNLWEGQNGPGMTGWAYVDGEVTVAIPAPKPAQRSGPAIIARPPVRTSVSIVIAEPLRSWESLDEGLENRWDRVSGLPGNRRGFRVTDRVLPAHGRIDPRYHHLQ